MKSSIAGNGTPAKALRVRTWRPLMAVAAGCSLMVLKNAPGVAADAAAPEAAAGPVALEEVVVTANRREESLSKVPISVSAYTQSTMDALGIKDFTDIARYTPGVQIDSGQTNAISIRGISSSGGAGTTGIYIDDTPIQIRALGFNPDDTLPKTFDLDRVEVLRGPQGTLFGAGSEGGTVRYLMTQPSLTRASGYARAELSYTQGGEPNYEAGVAYGAPLVQDALGFRVSAWYRRDGGWIDRVSDNDPSQVVDANANHDETTVLRAALIWSPLAGVTVTPSVMMQDRKRHDPSYFWQYGSLYSNPADDHFTSANPTGQPMPDKYWLSQVKLSADLGPVQLISNSAWYERRDLSGYDGTLYNLSYYQTFGWAGGETTVPGHTGSYLPAAGSFPYTGSLPCQAQGFSCYPLLDGSGVHLPAALAGYTSPASVQNNQDNLSQEIRFQSSDANAPFVWTIGGFYSLNKTYSLEEIHDPGVDAFMQYLWGANFAQIMGSDYNQSPVATNSDGSTYLPAGDSYLNRITAYDRQLAGFADVTLRGDLVRLPASLKLTAGIRYSQTDYSFRSYNDGPQNGGPGGGVGEDHEHPVTKRFSLSWQIDPADMVYATYSTGFRIGGANSNIPYDLCQSDFDSFGLKGNPAAYKSDTVKNYEIGTKDTFGGRLRISTSAYYIEWNNIQQTVVLPSCELQYVDNVGAAVSKGADLQADLAITDNLTLQSAVGYNSSYYTSAAFPGHTVPDDPSVLPLVGKGDAIVGESGTANAPWTITLGAEYRFHLLDHDTYVRVDAEHETRNSRLTAQEDPSTGQYSECSTGSGDVVPCNRTPSATTFVSARAGQEFNGWNISVFADNLFDTHTITNYNFQGTDPFGPQIAGPASTAAVATPLYRYMTYRPRTIGITATYRF